MISPTSVLNWKIKLLPEFTLTNQKLHKAHNQQSISQLYALILGLYRSNHNCEENSARTVNQVPITKEHDVTKINQN